MKKIIIILLLLTMTINVEAKTKQDIVDYVYANAKCGLETAIFKSYHQTYTRLLNEKELTEEEINEVIKQLGIAYSLINKHDACSLNDLEKFSKIEKESLFNALTIGSDIILNAPSIVDGESGGEVIYERETKTIKVYDREALVDKIVIEAPKLTYTGSNQYQLVYLLILIIVLFVFKKINKKSFVNDLLNGFIFSMIIIFATLIIFSPQIKQIEKVKNLFKENLNQNIIKEIVVKDGQIIRYPAYGNHYGDLLIPNLGLNLPIAFGDSEDILKNYIGHKSDSFFPGEGNEIIYSGHNSEKMLNNLQKISLNDQVVVNVNYGQYIYRVKEIKTIEDTDLKALEKEGEWLIIYTCYPFNRFIYGSKRFVVYAMFEQVVKEGVNYD